MKTFRTALVAALLLAAGPALAQWQTPVHSVPIGKGSGNQGFSAAAPGTSGRPLVSTGPSSDPAFGTIANSGFTSGAADTYKGSLDGVNVSDVPRAPCTAVNKAIRYTAGVGESCGTVSVTTGFDMPVNLGLSASASGGALTINLTAASGAAPTSSVPVLVPFRSLTAANGTVTWSTITSGLSLTIPSGATLGTSNSVPFRIWLFIDHNAGTPALGAATCSNPTTVFACASWESTLVTSTAISSSSNSAGVLYATAGVTLDAVRIIGYCDFGSGLSAVGTWASSCTTLQTFGPGIKKPGDIVQIVTGSTSSATTVSNTTNTATNLTATIMPNSAANLVRAVAYGNMATASAGAALPGQTQLFRNTGSVAIGNVTTSVWFGSTGGTAAGNSSTVNFALDAPGSASATQYGVYIKNSAGGTATWSFLGTVNTAPANTGFIMLEEIMG